MFTLYNQELFIQNGYYRDTKTLDKLKDFLDKIENISHNDYSLHLLKAIYYFSNNDIH